MEEANAVSMKAVVNRLWARPVCVWATAEGGGALSRDVRRALSVLQSDALLMEAVDDVSFKAEVFVRKLLEAEVLSVSRTAPSPV